MIALGILLVAAAYISLAFFLAWLVARAFQSQRAKAASWSLTLLVFVLIPTWDIVPGRLYFDHLCETAGGIKIYKTVKGVQGFYYFPGAEFRSEALTDYGYKFLEAGKAGSYFYYQVSNGKLIRKETKELVSDFGVVQERRLLPWNIKSHSERIIRIDSRQTLATKTQFSYAGSWIQRRASPFFGGGYFCPHLPPSSPSVRTFYVSTLRTGM